MNPRIALVLKLAALVGLIVFPSFGSSFYTEMVAKMLILGIFAMSLDLLVGFTGLVSLGHAAYFGIAAYTVALLTPKYDPANFWIALPAAVLAAAAAAFVIGLFVLRTKGIYFIMVTLAFAQMVYFIFHDTALGGGSDGIYVNFKPDATIAGWQPFNLDEPLQLYYFVVAALVAVFVFLTLVLRSPFGKVLVGIRSNEHRMQSLGYATFRYKLAAFTLAGGLAGVAGFLYAVLFGFVTPEYLSWHQSGNVLMMVILGGMGNLAGAVIGAFAFIGLQEMFADWTKHWQLLMGGVIVAAVLFMPGGLSALPGRVLKKLNQESKHG
ncbi:branched-chain amino acid ABC transporter permease [Parazoarcus communis]|mgnify:CR=1 FL=1|uniref:Branched-chain amino acid ABC transporter permease n=1 Tax=Parazoarcus communis SWub3 = DSM 12120 TaxID=1121029 RepID=A0A323UW91_9RHOO|nr:branched-chain amino acid ABC transporter permease [Parazoarcus communis]NMG68862.1 branched-chain amino acid ABC transporter permease [Parazoarcus communis SWub3 = DSM 12120]PZA16744.1 branched-chain amino acid ABC transporter permease [Azoarcus communis] [Parazoarcus communis SWub3 = DSM 12120]